MKISQREIESVSELKPFDRYKYLLKKIADIEAVYSLSNDLNEWALAEVDGQKVISIWSAEEFAQKFIVDSWRDYKVSKISLMDFKSDFISFAKSHNYLINVFPVGTKAGFIVTVDEFIRDVDIELEKYD